MSQHVYIYFGNDTFKILPKGAGNDINEIHPTSSNSKAFRSTLKDSDIQEIFLGWSFSIFKIGDKFYHAGFPNAGDQLTQVFRNLEAKDLVISCAENKVYACTSKGKFCCYSTQCIKPTTYNLSEQNLNVQSLVSGDIHTIALMHDGSVFLVNMAGRISLSLSLLLLPCPITKVTCGKEHTLFLSKAGQVFSFGTGSRGQLGHGTIENATEPTLLEALDGVLVKSIDCGGWHSVAISYSGDLYIWGWNESGQLGLPCAQQYANVKPLKDVETVCCLPKVVEFPEEKLIESVSCGTRHTAVLTDDAEVWTWGWNDYGQLGHENKPVCDKPVKLLFSEKFVPKKIKCAFWSTLISGIFKP